TIVGGPDDHASHILLTGWDRQGPQAAGGWPTIGSFVSKLQGAFYPTVPSYVGLAAKMIHPPYNDPGPGFLGAAHAAFTPDGHSRSNLDLHRVSRDRLSDRTSLRARFGDVRRDIDNSGMTKGWDTYQQRAFNGLT